MKLSYLFEPTPRSRTVIMEATGERRDAPSPSIVDFHHTLPLRA
jgi:hypothetical protein